MLTSEPTMTTSDLARITSPTLVLVGDDDMMELSHTCELYESLTAGQLSVIHAVLLEKSGEVSRIIGDFLAGAGIAQTLMPLRRSTNATPLTS